MAAVEGDVGGGSDDGGGIELSENEPGHYTALLTGELDIQSVERLNGLVEEFLTLPVTRLEFDLSQLEFMDSSGLALLLRMTNQFGPADVRGAKPLIRRVIEVSGLTEVLRLEGGSP
jgi:anti-sigma B factor antagonist